MLRSLELHGSTKVPVIWLSVRIGARHTILRRDGEILADDHHRLVPDRFP